MRTYKRELSKAEQESVINHINWRKRKSFKNVFFVAILLFVLVVILFFIWFLESVGYTIFGVIIFSLISYQVYGEIQELLELPKLLELKEDVANSFTATVNETSVDRYIRIENNNEFSFIIEHNGILTVPLGYQFSSLQTLSQKIEFVEIESIEKGLFFHFEENTIGENLNPYHVFDMYVSDEFTKSEVWKKIMENNQYKGGLEEFDPLINRTD